MKDEHYCKVSTDVIPKDQPKSIGDMVIEALDDIGDATESIEEVIGSDGTVTSKVRMTARAIEAGRVSVASAGDAASRIGKALDRISKATKPLRDKISKAGLDRKEPVPREVYVDPPKPYLSTLYTCKNCKSKFYSDEYREKCSDPSCTFNCEGCDGSGFFMHNGYKYKCKQCNVPIPVE